jgi:hypothetical protein
MIDPSPFRNALIGKPVSHVWRGYGSAFFLEFGKLTPRKRKSGEAGNPMGELTLMVEWSWRIERKYSMRLALEPCLYFRKSLFFL